MKRKTLVPATRSVCCINNNLPGRRLRGKSYSKNDKIYDRLREKPRQTTRFSEKCTRCIRGTSTLPSTFSITFVEIASLRTVRRVRHHCTSAVSPHAHTRFGRQHVRMHRASFGVILSVAHRSFPEPRSLALSLPFNIFSTTQIRLFPVFFCRLYEP